MTVLIATSVVRGSQQGDSHGGIYLVDLQKQQARQMLDWNTADIDWQGRGWDRGLRGIAFAGERIFIAASDELYAFTPDFRKIGSWRSPYLKHCHEICLWQDHIFLTSTGYDSILGFNLNSEKFDWALALDTDGMRYRAATYDPAGDDGPMMLNKLHINSIHCNKDGMYIAGLKTEGLLHFNGRAVNMSATLPAGTHNARPFQDGVLFNDTRSDVVRFASRDHNRDRFFPVPKHNSEELVGLGLDQSGVARVGFGRGLCVLDDHLIAAGSSPSTIAVHDLDSGETALSVRLSNDVRNAIHGLEVWPF
ncbi:hypothetical protein [Biformimicrobium ophioploci]|uniref:Uncharacterized protein n=1 Tax=Biformimicrobium ophioploci TaxID=3036711 RepID=A0ABQ6LVM3_9GAMM|nr:hypothetical protein [Microbulbifer sp. NKW57]GMG86147.1 hypothetical protein MNKW57_04680 [Microbulbifer sp. NKW57]